jgi:hypothetical protein
MARRRRKAHGRRLVENPQVFPRYVYAEPANTFNAVELRGGPFFDALAREGFDVMRISAGGLLDVEAIRRPWTFIYLPVPSADVVDAVRSWYRRPCSVIMDVHFPLINQETIIGDDEAILQSLEFREQMIANLGVACAVTVSQEQWAADLAAVNPRVWFLPDLHDDDPDSGDAFAVKFVEMCQSTLQACYQHNRPDPAEAA